MALTKASFSMISGSPANVLDYGADSSGLTDSTAAIQAAIDSGATTIYFPDGTYLVGFGIANDGYAFSLNSVDGLSLIGDGRATIKCYSASTYFSIFELIDCSNLLVQGLRFNGDAFAWYPQNPYSVSITNGYRAFDIKASSDILITECDFTGFFESSINLKRRDDSTGYCTRINITDNIFHELGNHGIGAVYATYCKVTDNIFKDVGQNAGFEITPGVWWGGGLAADMSNYCNRIIITNNVVDGASGGFKLETETSNSIIDGNNIGNIYTYGSYAAGFITQWYGIKVNGVGNIVSNNVITANVNAIQLASNSDNCIVQGNRILSTSYATNGYGIRVEGGTNNAIIGNTVTSCANYGIIASGVNTVINENSVSLCAADGVRTYNCTNISVKNNQVFDNTGNGIYLSDIGGTTDYAHVTGNYCYDTGGATQTVAIYYNGTVAPQAFVFGNRGYGQTDNGNLMRYGAAAPSVGTWGIGDIVWNTTVAAGGSPGWVCTTAGTPGTWKAMANVAA